MALIDQMLELLNERKIAREVSWAHNDARGAYTLPRTIVDSFDEFCEIIGDYYAYHFARCLGPGSYLSKRVAVQEAREIIEREYRREGGIEAAFRDARDGDNRGLLRHLDLICDAMRNREVERYVRHVFDALVAPVDWDRKVQLIREYIARCDASLAQDIDRNTPERYAADYQALVRAYVEGLRHASKAFRRL
jgi:hypothetical protein